VYTRGLPVIVIGLPKEGTTSLHSFFQCAGLASAHHFVDLAPRSPALAAAQSRGVPSEPSKNVRGGRSVFFGHAVHACARAGAPLLSCLPGYDAYTQLDVEDRGCFFPQITHLEGLLMDYPNATFVLPRRSAKHWFRSTVDWGPAQRRMDVRLAKNCSLPTFELPTALEPPATAAAAMADGAWERVLVDFHERFHLRARAILARGAQRFGTSWAEVGIESPAAAEQLVSALPWLFGPGRAVETAAAARACWQHRNKNTHAEPEPPRPS